jgi:hypothetical protein
VIAPLSECSEHGLLLRARRRHRAVTEYWIVRLRG